MYVCCFLKFLLQLCLHVLLQDVCDLFDVFPRKASVSCGVGCGLLVCFESCPGVCLGLPGVVVAALCFVLLEVLFRSEWGDVLLRCRCSIEHFDLVDQHVFPKRLHCRCRGVVTGSNMPSHVLWCSTSGVHCPSNVFTALRCVPCGSGEISNTLSVLTPMNSIPGFVSIQALDSSVALTLRPYLCFALTSASEKELVLHL